MISKFTNNSDNIFNHILKVLVYDDSYNNKKHLREMSGIVRSLQNKTIKSKIALEDLSEEILKKSFRTFEEYSELRDRI